MSSYAPKAVAAYYAAEQAHDDNRWDGDTYVAALHALDDWQPATATDFVHKFIALHHDGWFTELRPSAKADRTGAQCRVSYDRRDGMDPSRQG